MRGAVPGAKGGWVRISDAVKHPVPEDAPFPAGLRAGGAEAAPATDVEAAAEAGVEAGAPVADPAAEDAGGAEDKKE